MVSLIGTYRGYDLTKIDYEVQVKVNNVNE